MTNMTLSLDTPDREAITIPHSGIVTWHRSCFFYRPGSVGPHDTGMFFFTKSILRVTLVLLIECKLHKGLVTNIGEGGGYKTGGVGM